MNYTKREAIATVVKCAKEYDKRLANTSLLIIYRDRIDNQLKYIEVYFRPTNYQHLTGVLLVDANNNILKNKSLLFYHKCLTNQLTTDDIIFKPDHTTPLKLMALPSLMELTKITRITGDYDKTKPVLYADKVVGGVNYCLAVVENQDGTYFPISGLMEDIREITSNQSQVLAILQKNIYEKHYSNIRYVAKGLKIESLNMPEILTRIIRILP